MAQKPQWAKASSLLRIHDYTPLDTPHSVGFLWTDISHRIPLDELSAVGFLWTDISHRIPLDELSAVGFLWTNH